MLRVEQDRPTTSAAAYRLSDLELASRLSFFLWSSIPDDELLDLAAREAASGQRIVESNDGWLAIVPFWAAWPFETLLLPRFKVERLPPLADDQRDSLGAII